MHAFFCALSFVLGELLGVPGKGSRWQCTSCIRKQEVCRWKKWTSWSVPVAGDRADPSRLFGDEVDLAEDEEDFDEDGEEDEGEEDGSDADSFRQHLAPNGRKARSRSRGSRSINSSRKVSPMPSRRDPHAGPSGLFSGLSDAVASIFGQKRNRGTVRGDYDAVGGEQ